MAQYPMNMPSTKVDWRSNQAYPQFRMWRREVTRIVNGPMAKEKDPVKLNTVFIWAGAYVETLVEAREAEDPDLSITTVEDLLDVIEECLTHSTYYREAREDFYTMKQNSEESATSYHSRVIEMYKLAAFPKGAEFLITDKLIHGCANMDCKRKLMGKSKDITSKQCLDILRQHEAVSTTMQRLACHKVSAAYSQDRKHQKNNVMAH